MTHSPSKPVIPTALMRYAALLALVAAAGTLHAETSGSNNMPPTKDIYELKPINAGKQGLKDLPYKVETSIPIKRTIKGDPEDPPTEDDIQWSADKGTPEFSPYSGASVDLDFGKPFIKEETDEARKVMVTATYSGPASVENSPQKESKKVKLTYLDFLVARTVESTDDILIVRGENCVLAPTDKKVIHWAKVVVKHSATGKLPLQLESFGAQPLYFYGEQSDPNQLTEDPTLEATLSKEYNTGEWFWIGTAAKGTGEGKFKAKGDLGTGFKDAPEEKTVRLLPVDIAIRKKGELAAPTTGLLVKKGDSLEIALAPQFFDSEDNFESLITWQYRQLKGDGSYTPWTAFGANATGTKFEHLTTAGGIFQVKALINGAGEHEYKRRNDAPHGANSAGTYNEKLRKGELDFVGVVDKDIQIPIRNQAMVLLGSAAYAKSGSLLVGFGVDPTLDFRESWKCNIFVFQVSNFMSLPVGTKTWRDYRFGVPPYTDRQVPPGANDWYNSAFSIPSWIWVASSALPQPGYVAIHQHTSDPVSGGAHMGVLDYDGTWINAGATRVNKSQPSHRLCMKQPEP